MSSHLREQITRNPEGFLSCYREKVKIGYHGVTETISCDDLIQQISLTIPEKNCALTVGTFPEFPDHNFSPRRYRNILENLCILVSVSGVWLKIYWHKEKEMFCLDSTPKETCLPGEKIFCVVLQKIEE
jgi:hypothetical protein